MLHFSLDGTITYRQGAEAIPGWEYELDARFSEHVEARIEERHLHCLRTRYRGDLTVERLPDGNLRISRSITAHGPESALRQAEDLRCDFYRFLGLHMNIARPL